MDCATLLFFWALFGIAGYYIGQKKDINPFISIIAGIILGPFVFLMYFVSPEGKKCPKCAESVKKDAAVCKYCGHQFA